MRRLVAHITFENSTSLKVGSNNLDALQDSPIQRDWNGLPMILGTSLAGILRKNFDLQTAEEIFGCNHGRGSKILFSNALLLNENNRVSEELLLEKSTFLQNFLVLPIREHTAITSRGVTKEHSKFDEEIVYKGSRFRFRIEMLIEKDEDRDAFFKVLDFLNDETLRIGSGNTKGRGAIKVLEIKYEEFDENSEAYSNLSCSLNAELKESYSPKYIANDGFSCYELTLIPEDFFIFGSGGGDEDADRIGVAERIVDYKNKKLTERKIVIPASAVKGALSHRTSFYYHKLKEIFIGEGEAIPSVYEIFGNQKDKNIESHKGKLILTDIYCQEVNERNQKVFAHVKIDNFTGGGIDGALFQEKTNTMEFLESFTLKIWIKNDVEKIALEAFELALKDLAKGALALGGASNKGHGFFQGNIVKNGEKL